MTARPRNWPAAPAPGIRLIAGRPILDARAAVQRSIELEQELDNPEGDFFDGLKIVVLIVCMLLAAALVGLAARYGYALIADADDAVLTSKIAAEAADRKLVGPYDYQKALSLPIRYAATVCQYPARVPQRPCRYYFGKDPA